MKKGLWILASSLSFMPVPVFADEVETLIDDFEKFSMEKMEAETKSFLTAKTVEEKSKFVRDPARVGPLMKSHYQKLSYQPEGFEELNRTTGSYRGKLASLSVTTGDFLDYPITMEREVKDGKETYLVDWESWVGYCEKTPKEMKAEKPTTPFLVRALVEDSDYYNYDFSDEKRWKSFTLFIGKSQVSVTGYALRDSELEKRISQNPEDSLSVILKVAYPENAKNDDQVLITEIVNLDGWVIGGEVAPREKDTSKADQ
jgi:hypothetical protein